MSALIEGNFMAKSVSAEFGVNKKGVAELSVEFEITEGANAGRKVGYSGLFNEKSTKYTKAAMLALGWQGKSADTIVADIKAAAKVVPIEVQIASWKNPDTGKVSEWSTVRNVGRFKEPLKPIASGDLKDVNQWLNEVGDVGAPANDDKLPF
jgi:hypothetical protein